MTGRALSAEAKAAFWKANDKLAQRWEAKFAAAATKEFNHDLRELKALLTDAKTKALTRKATVDWQEYLLSVDDYLNMAGSESWRKAFLPLIRGVMEARGEQLNADFGMEFDVRNLFAEEWFDKYVLEFAQPIMETTADDISQLMQTAQEEGWSVPQMDKALDELFNQYIEGGGLSEEARQWFEERLPAYRRELIARTETIRASNAGSNALYKGWQINRKEWLATADDRTRPEHQVGVTWGQAPLVVGIDDTFTIGGEELAYPGDPAGSPANFCNCRCTVLPVIE